MNEEDLARRIKKAVRHLYNKDTLATKREIGRLQSIYRKYKCRMLRDLIFDHLVESGELIQKEVDGIGTVFYPGVD